MFQTQTAATHECIKIDLSMVTFFTQTRLHTFVYQRNGDNVHVLSSFMANRWKCDLLQFRFEKATHTHTLAFTHIHFSGKRFHILNGLFTACDVSVCFFLLILIYQYILLVCYLCTEMKIIEHGQKCSVSNGKEMGLRLRDVWGIWSRS